jgi:hypothetical protein
MLDIEGDFHPENVQCVILASMAGRLLENVEKAAPSQSLSLANSATALDKDESIEVLVSTEPPEWLEALEYRGLLLVPAASGSRYCRIAMQKSLRPSGLRIHRLGILWFTKGSQRTCHTLPLVSIP